MGGLAFASSWYCQTLNNSLRGADRLQQRRSLSRPRSSKIGVLPTTCRRMASRDLRMCTQTDEKPRTAASEAGSAIGSDVRSIFGERIVAAGAYVFFALFSFFLAPGSFTEPGEFQRIFAGNFDEANDLFFALFNLAGASGVVFAALLNAGAPRQKKLSTRFFSFLGVVVGFLGLGPYLIGREYVPSISREEVEEQGIFSRILESRLFSFVTLLYSLWIYAFSFGLFTPGSEQLHDVMFYAASVDFWRLFVSDRGVCTTTIDVLILSIALWGPLTEDMRRRGWFRGGHELESNLTAASILAAPALGPALYLLLRPRLPKRSRSPSKTQG